LKNTLLSLIIIIGFCGKLIAQDIYSVKDSLILKNSVLWEFVGTDNMAVFSLPYNYSPQQSLGMDITRECIDMKLTTDAKLQSLVTSARSKGQVLILAGFWYDSDAFSGGKTPYPDCQLLGANPQADPRWNAVMSRWKQIASLAFIKNKTDVWINPWNEPYYWDGTHGYTNDMWEKDAKAMIDSIRGTGAKNIVVIEGSHTGQGHAVIIERGKNVRQGRENIVFDLHAYSSKWNISASAIRSRFQAIRNAGNAFIIGEFANNGDEVSKPVMDACRAEKVSLLAWLWGQYKEPFATSFKQYSQAPRNQTTAAAMIETESISVFPNPVQNKLMLQGLNGNRTYIELHNILGNLEYKTEIENKRSVSLDLQFLNHGIYILQIRQMDKLTNLKIIRN